MNQFTKLAELRSAANTKTLVGYDFRVMFQEMASRGEADVAIVGAEDGFSPLGGSSQFFEDELGVPYDRVIMPLADWNRFENPRVTLVAIKRKNPHGKLRGVILAPGSNAVSYDKYRTSSYHQQVPNRDYYYNVSYEAISYVCTQWGAKKIAISHLCCSNDFHEDMATCHAEALAHFCDATPMAAPESFVFCCCCIELDQLKGIRRLNEEGQVAVHKPIKVETEVTETATLLHLDWS